MAGQFSTTTPLRRVLVGALVGPALVLLWLLLGTGPAHAVSPALEGSGLGGVVGSLTGDSGAGQTAKGVVDKAGKVVEKAPEPVKDVVDPAVSQVAEPAVEKSVDVVNQVAPGTGGTTVGGPVAAVTEVVEDTVKTVTGTIKTSPRDEAPDGLPDTSDPGDEEPAPTPESPAGLDDSTSLAGDDAARGNDSDRAGSAGREDRPVPATELASRLLGDDLSGYDVPEFQRADAVFAEVPQRADNASLRAWGRPLAAGPGGPGSPTGGEASSSGTSGPSAQVAGPVITFLLRPPAALVAVTGESWALPSSPSFSPGPSPD